jgi:hypothetical protein
MYGECGYGNAGLLSECYIFAVHFTYTLLSKNGTTQRLEDVLCCFFKETRYSRDIL